MDVLLLGLVGLVAGDHALGGSGGAADGSSLLQQDDVSALVVGFHSGSHASAASANDDHVSGVLEGLSGIVHDLGHLEGLNVSTGSDQSSLSRVDDGVGGQGGTGHDVHQQGLLGDDRGGDGLNDGLEETLGLVVGHNGHGLDGVIGHDDGHLHVAHLAHGFALVGTGGHGAGAGSQHHHSQEERNDLLHDGKPLSNSSDLPLVPKRTKKHYKIL